MSIVAPSLLSCDFLNIETEIHRLNKFKNIWYHLDIMDGHFVPNLTFGHPIVKMMSKIATNPLDAHFMVSNPNFYVETFKDYNIHNFTFHFEATNDSVAVIQEAKKHYESVGISIKPKTEVKELSKEILELVDLILVMSVEPGFGGQKFIEKSIEKTNELSELRENNNYHYQIQVDGGVNDQNCKILRNNGANNLVAGSYVFKNGPDHYEKQIDSIR